MKRNPHLWIDFNRLKPIAYIASWSRQLKQTVKKWLLQYFSRQECLLDSFWSLQSFGAAWRIIVHFFSFDEKKRTKELLSRLKGVKIKDKRCFSPLLPLNEIVNRCRTSLIGIISIQRQFTPTHGSPFVQSNPPLKKTDAKRLMVRKPTL